ncbi:hypothetical protein [Methylocucumis oryzae]|uniref:PAS domain-containing protein n=1 Tax=Methylocucumis oryzae TaxID=1632867 RepID=A0A0F3IJI8_9GAMM|nr:hypothetical protein [Methylocucumis oryzae]KJV06683.1 hypothetical protein VZ94_09790 [Methylocucumis oryzae]
MIQMIGISLALLNFIIIIRHFIRHLRMSDAKAEAARQENQDILDSVSEGLFLLDQNGVIGAGHSKSIEEIFKTTQLTGNRLLEVLKPLVPEKSVMGK